MWPALTFDTAEHDPGVGSKTAEVSGQELNTRTPMRKEKGKDNQLCQANAGAIQVEYLREGE